MQWQEIALDPQPSFSGQIQSQHLVVTYKIFSSRSALRISDTPPRLYLSPKEINDARTLLRQQRDSRRRSYRGDQSGAT